MPTNRRFLVFFLDIVLITCAYCLALLPVVDSEVPLFSAAVLKHTIPYVVGIQSAVFLTSNLYRSIWKYASLHDAVEIFKTVSTAIILSGLGLFFFSEGEHFSRVVLILNWGILLMLVMSSRFVWRFYRENYLLAMPGRSGNGSGERTLIVGAGDAGNMLLREILKQSPAKYRVVGFVDDDQHKQHMRMLGIEVLGTVDSLPQIIARNDVEMVIIAVPSAGPKFVRALVKQCKQSGVRCKIVPGLSEIIRGDVNVSHIRDVEIEDLLGRVPVRLDERAVERHLKGKRVLVSGAAGSIGSEICRQIARYSPAMLVLLDNAETPLFYIERELSAGFPELHIVARLGDVRDKGYLEQAFEEIIPEAVFHAAAYKHVPMLEHNPAEAVLCNVMGSMNIAAVSKQFGVQSFLMVSTDKAVNPTNVMGATKRIAEKFVQALADGSKTRFSVVRFGNVLGSNGSVIPLFSEQIRKGGPLTITHPDITRFFMTIPEASQLVLQANCFGEGGEIFVLDMGEPVKIVELAEELVRLSGMTPHADIEFVYTGLRPGEKLYEELFFQGEKILATPHEKIRVVAPVPQDYRQLTVQLEKLLRAARDNDRVSIGCMLREIVPEYLPTGEISRAGHCRTTSTRRFNPSVLPQVDGDYNARLQ